MRVASPARDSEARQKGEGMGSGNGYDPVFGARPLKRVLQRHIDTKLARALITGEVGEGSDLTFNIRDDELAFSKEPVSAISWPQNCSEFGPLDSSRSSPYFAVTLTPRAAVSDVHYAISLRRFFVDQRGRRRS